MNKIKRGGVFRNLRKFLNLPGREKLFFIEATVSHLWIGLLLKVIPFRRIAVLYSSRQSGSQAQDENQGRPIVQGQLPGVGSHPSEIISLVREAVRRAGRVSPWRNRCLVSSLAARRMLNRRHILSRLSLGVAKDPGGRATAHAWLMSGGLEVTVKHGDFQELFVF